MIWTPPEPDFFVKLLFGLLYASVASLYDKLKSPKAIFLAGKNKTTTTTAANFYHDQPTFKF